jgi:hypothetical protein
MLSCQQIVDLTSDFLEKRLRLRDRWGFLMHIAMCRGCRAYVDQLRLTLHSLRNLPRKAPSAAVHDSLVRSFREASRDSDSE